MRVVDDRDFVRIEMRPKPAADLKLVDDPKVWSSVQLNPLIPQNQPGPEKYRHMPTEVVLPNNPTTPEKEIERFEDYLKRLYPAKNELTVGDLSIEKAQRDSPEQVRQRLRTIRDGFSVGDLSKVTDMKESLEKEVEARLAAKDEGLTVGDLYRGKRPSDIQPSQSESQRLAAEKIRKDRKRREKVFKIRQLLAEDSG